MSNQLFEAIDRHDATRIAELLSGGDDPNALQAEWPGLRPLHAAIYELEYGGQLEVVAMLLDHGADVNAWNAGGDVNPLLAAVGDRQPAAVELLLKRGADPTAVNNEGDSPLRSCANTGGCEVASLLLAAGATRTIDAWRGLPGYTALGHAAARLDVPMIARLLDAGADREASDEDDWRARDRLPPREASDPDTWDAAFALLRGALRSDPET